jgi:hypothetical protein
VLGGVEAEVPLEGGEPRWNRLRVLEISETEPWIPGYRPWYRLLAWKSLVHLGPEFGSSSSGLKAWRFESGLGLAGPASLETPALFWIRGLGGWQIPLNSEWDWKTPLKSAFLGAELGGKGHFFQEFGISGTIASQASVQMGWRGQGHAEGYWNFDPSLALILGSHFFWGDAITSQFQWGVRGRF